MYMKPLLNYFLASVFLLLTVNLTAQSYTLRLKNGPRHLAENVEAFAEAPDVKTTEVFEGRYYRLLQFYQIPTQELRETIEATGIQLLSYLPKNTYIASIPAQFDAQKLLKWNVRSVATWRPVDKMHSNLITGPYPPHALQGEWVKVMIKYAEDLGGEAVVAALLGENIHVNDLYEYGHTVNVAVDPARVYELAGLPFVTYAELVPAPAEQENLQARTNHRGNVLLTENGAGRNYDGSGIDVAINDGGLIGPHIDYHGRIGSENTSASSGNHHEDHVSGIVGGAGNLNPLYQGAAPGVEFHLYDGISVGNAFFLSFPGPYTLNNIRITNTSLSDGCNAGYNSNAERVDQHIRTLPGLMHVFSCGNMGMSTMCGLAGGWQTITGGNKQGKNVIAVANLAKDDVIQFSSSKGPSTDGRIKPDIAGVGNDVTSTMPFNTYASRGGTSMAAPGVAGLLAQLYQAYKATNGNQEPVSGLIKAMVLNTAEDLGTRGPDFTYGWGRVNGLRAVRLIENNQFIDTMIAQSQTHTIPLTVPANIAQLKIMVYWTDWEGNPTAATALVNDLDVFVQDPTLSNTFFPWVLDAGPNPTPVSIITPATVGIDTLNNMEQVQINNPVPGTYQMIINGTSVPQGPQQYFIVYEMLKDTIEVTYPVGGESLAPGDNVRIRWDAVDTLANFSVSYTLDNGTNWTTIGSANGKQRYLDWTVPNMVSGQARVRVARAGQADISDATFSIIAVPQNLRIVRVCQSYTSLEWDPVPGATGYDVYMLGARYMDRQGSTPITTYDVMGANFMQENWFSVRATHPADNVLGRRAVAVKADSGLFNCAAMPPVSDFTFNTAPCVGATFALQDMSLNQPSMYEWFIMPPNFTFVNGTNSNSPSPSIQFTSMGNYTITLVTTNFAGTDTIERVVSVANLQPTASFSPQSGGLKYIFVNNSVGGWFYEWDFGDGNMSVVQNPTHTYATSGVYTVTLKVSNPCGTAFSSQTVRPLGTALGDLLGDLEVTVNPNPSEGRFFFHASHVQGPHLTLQVMDLQGRTLQQAVHQQVAGEVKASLDLSTLAKGMYLLRVAQGERSGVMKLVVK